jgi:hypothetical protein
MDTAGEVVLKAEPHAAELAPFSGLSGGNYPDGHSMSSDLAPYGVESGVQSGGKRGDDRKRTFSVVRSTVRFDGGRYKSTEPGAASRKAGKQLMIKAESSNPTNTVVLELKETTRGSAGKSFFYRVTRSENTKKAPSSLGFVSKWEYKTSKATAADIAQLDNKSPR